MAMSVFAAESEYVDTVETVEYSTVNITSTASSTYSITVPKTIVLDGQTGTGEYEINVSGDIASDERINVIPDSSTTMTQEGKPDAIVTITQDKTNWKYNELDTSGHGLVSANLSAGCWDGSFTFEISITRKTGDVLIAGEDFNKTIPSTATMIMFTDEVAPSGAALTDVSEWQDNGIVSWLDGSTYKVSTQNPTKIIYANPDSSKMFYQKEKLKNIDFSNFTTQKVTNMSYMFCYAGYDVETFNIDLSNWDVSNVTNMNSMFKEVGYNATTWSIGDLSAWDVSNVTDMKSMFEGYYNYAATTWNIGNLDNWDVSNVTNMSYMFQYSGLYATVFNIGNISGWDVSNVTDMKSMFNCAGMSATYSLDLSSWNVDKVTGYSHFDNGVTDKIIPPIWKK